jgi:predicted acyltransferase
MRAVYGRVDDSSVRLRSAAVLMPAPGQRLAALDLLRGFTIAAMIVVNNPGNWNRVFPQLTHAGWNGITAADLVFPTFIFIMGAALAVSTGASGIGGDRRPAIRRIVSRSAVLVLLGLTLNAAAAWPHVDAMRIPGVLQRIGLTYLIAAMIARRAGNRALPVSAVALLLLHWAILALPLGLPMSGTMSPGQNVGVALDRMVFGSHLLTAAGDPEGLIGLITSVATALFGVGIGRWLIRERRLGSLAAAGAGAIAAGLLWSIVLPLNKALWTASFAVLACGAATLILAGLLVIERAGRIRPFAPLLWLGLNPLAIYFLSELVTNIVQRQWFVISGQSVAPKDWFYWDLLVPAMRDSGGPWSSLTYALLYTLFWIGAAGALRWKGVRLRA